MNSEKKPRPVAPKLDGETIDFFRSRFPSLNGAIEYIANSFPPLYTRSIQGMAGKFSANELKLILDAMNGTLLTPALAGQHVALNVADSITLNHFDKKWDVDKDQILPKLNALSVFDRAILEIWCGAFWLSANQADPDQYIAPLLKTGEKI